MTLSTLLVLCHPTTLSYFFSAEGEIFTRQFAMTPAMPCSYSWKRKIRHKSIKQLGYLVIKIGSYIIGATSSITVNRDSDRLTFMMLYHQPGNSLFSPYQIMVDVRELSTKDYAQSSTKSGTRESNGVILICALSAYLLRICGLILPALSSPQM